MAEGGGLLNRYTVKSRIGGSNPPPSAIRPCTRILRQPRMSSESPASASFCRRQPHLQIRRVTATRLKTVLCRPCFSKPSALVGSGADDVLQKIQWGSVWPKAVSLIPRCQGESDRDRKMRYGSLERS